jgi:hypothetical protein
MAEQNGTLFKWNKARNDAAWLLAEDDLTDVAICEAVGIGRTTLFTWKQHPDFAAKIAENVATIDAAMMKLAIAKKHKRVASLDRDWRRMERVQEARAVEHSDVPGGDTGLLVRQIKQIGAGRDVQVVEEYVVDTALLKEKRETMKQAATELGQWTDRSATELSGEIGVHNTYADILAEAEADAGGSADDHQS